jgi:mRNA interferase RelE/StbE
MESSDPRAQVVEATEDASDRFELQRVRAAIDLLAEQPRPPGCRALTGESDAYRVRVGDYRMVYEVIDDRLIVHVVRVGHRRDVHRRSRG